MRPGDRVDLEHLRPVGAEDQVDAGEARAAERLVGRQRRLGHGGGLRLRRAAAGQTNEVRPIS